MTNFNIVTWSAFLIGLIFIIWIFSLLSRFVSFRQSSLMHHNEQLQNEIESKQKALSLLNLQIESNTIDNNVKLTAAQISVLNIYEDSHIRIPADILEDLSSRKFSSEKEIFSYIENQRSFWKLENTKKPYKG